MTLFMFTASFIYSNPFLENFELTKHAELPFTPPTERQLSYETPAKIKKNLSRISSSGNWEFWNKIVAHEERGVFGYHAAKQEVRIFHDVVKMIFEEILEFEIKKDFYFFRIPLDPELHEYSLANDFLKAFPKINDGIAEQRTQIISLNYSLFGNYAGDGSQCTVCYFAENKSWFKVDYAARLSFLFEQLGIPITQVNFLFSAGNAIEDFSTGVIYQFFDHTHFVPQKIAYPYSLIDFQAYPARAAGPFDHAVTGTLSTLFQNTTPKKFDLNQGQLRLIMNTKWTLNPYGSLSIRRYDKIDPKTVAAYERELRARVQKLARDPVKVEQYKKMLKEHWYAN